MTHKYIHVLTTGALLAASVPAFADHGRWQDSRWERGYRQERVVIQDRRPARRIVVERPVYVDRPTVVEQPVYVDRPVYVEAPAPDYYPPVYGSARVAYPTAGYPVRREPNLLGAGIGAAVGAVVGSQVGHGHSQGATTAVGAIIGGVLGSQF